MMKCVVQSPKGVESNCYKVIMPPIYLTDTEVAVMVISNFSASDDPLAEIKRMRIRDIDRLVKEVIRCDGLELPSYSVGDNNMDKYIDEVVEYLRTL